MPPSEKTPFCKHEDCPASGELLEFQRGKLDDARRSEIQAHLEACEFCDAETEFYSQYPQDDLACETAENVEIPAPLYELAEALLKNRQADSSALDALMPGKRGLALKKA